MQRARAGRPPPAQRAPPHPLPSRPLPPGRVTSPRPDRVLAAHPGGRAAGGARQAGARRVSSWRAPSAAAALHQQLLAQQIPPLPDLLSPDAQRPSRLPAAPQQAQPAGPAASAPATPGSHPPAAATAARLTKALARAASPAELLALLLSVQRAQPQLVNAIHVSAAFSRAAKFVGAAPAAAPTRAPEPGLLCAIVEHLTPLLQQQLPALGPRALANTLWAMAKLRHVPSDGLLAQLLAQLDAAMPRMRPQEQSSVLYGLALWAQQAAGTPPAAPVLPGSRALERQLTPPRLAAYWAATQQLLPVYGPQALANALYAAAALDGAGTALVLSPAWQQGFWAACERQLPAFSPQQLGNVVWAAARLAETRRMAPPPRRWMDLWLVLAEQQLAASSMQVRGWAAKGWVGGWVGVRAG